MRRAQETEKKLGEKYGYDQGALFEDIDFSPIAAMYFNPYYSLMDWIHFDPEGIDDETADRICEGFLLSEITEFQMPVYVLQGKRDCQCGAIQEYFDMISAPEKELRVIVGNHSSTMAKSDLLADFIHGIAEKYK